MKREILFRGKLEYNGKWIYGDLLQYENGDVAIFGEKLSSFGCECTEMSKRDRVIPDTIGQYTGLKDKNGKKIFEGDIISYYTTETYCINPDCDLAVQGYGSKLIKKECEVKYIDGSFCIDDETYCPLPISNCGVRSEDFDEFKATVENDFYFDTNGYKLNDSIIGIEIIGNVTDNPELMK